MRAIRTLGEVCHLPCTHFEKGVYQQACTALEKDVFFAALEKAVHVVSSFGKGCVVSSFGKGCVVLHLWERLCSSLSSKLKIERCIDLLIDF